MDRPVGMPAWAGNPAEEAGDLGIVPRGGRKADLSVSSPRLLARSAMSRITAVAAILFAGEVRFGDPHVLDGVLGDQSSSTRSAIIVALLFI